MALMSYITEMRKKYLRNQIGKVKIPDFNTSPVIRRKFIFSGKVQKVGFRVETHGMGKRLGLIGWVKNNEDKTVEAEVQGEEEKIDFLIKYLKSIKRASVEELKVEDLLIIDEEAAFKIIM